MLVNGDFGMVSLSAENSTYYFPDYWEKKSGILSAKGSHVIMDRAESNLPAELSGNALSLYSRPNRDSVAFGQIIYNRGAKGDCFTVGGWCNARSVAKIPDSSIKNAPCIAYRFYDSDTNPGSWKYLNFSREWVGWQFGCWAITAPEAYTRLEIHVNYARNAQKCMFSNIFVHREQFGKTFAYDDKKNVTSVANLSETKSNMEYDAYDNLTSYTQPGGSDSDKYTMTYGDTTTKKKKHLLETSTTPEKVKQKFEYDTLGNQISAATVNDLASPTLFIKTRTEYTNGDEVNPLPPGINNNYPYKTYDARGYAVTRTMRTDNYMLASVKDPTGQKVLYDYDDSLRVKEVRAEVPITIESADAEPGSEGENEQETPKDVYYNKYTYDNDRLKTVRHNTDANEANDVIYTFDYDGLGRKTTVKVGNQVLSTNVYSDADNSNDRKGLLEKVQYGNGGEVAYIHDDFDRIKAIRYDKADKDRYTYEYGANGQAALMKDHHLNRVHRTEYDLAERPCQATIREMNEDGSEGDLIYRTTLTYDKKNRLQDFAESLPEESHKTSYTYDKDNRTTVIQYDDAEHKVEYKYDVLGRINERIVTNGKNIATNEDITYSSTYEFVDCEVEAYGTGATTPLVKEINQPHISFEYSYDPRGNIEWEKRSLDVDGNTSTKTTTYKYDALGQLIRVNDPNDTTAGEAGTTWVYVYDLGGNIKHKRHYAYTTAEEPGEQLGEVNYVYGDANWKDKLTQYSVGDGLVELDYDQIGNLKSYDGWGYEWEAGRQLKRQTKGTKVIFYEYDHTGMRTRKIIGNTDGEVSDVYTYIYHGLLLTHMTNNSDELYFFYDDQSRPAMVKYDGVMYTYVYNLQGDVVGIVDSNNELVVEYRYSAWGSILSKSGSMASTLGHCNPFCYRGYIYDEEIGMYWIESRYYYPELHRFISADTLVQYNTYEYCNSNPVNQLDHAGNSSVSYMKEKAALHDIVALKVALIVGGTVERQHTFLAKAGRNGGPGYPDVIVQKANFVWEIKPDSPYGERSGPRQMARYTSAGALPGYAISIRPFEYILNGKPGIVFAFSGTLPHELGVVYYRFVELEMASEPVYTLESVQQTQTCRGVTSSTSLALENMILLGLGLLVCVLSPVPGDEVAAAISFANFCASGA